MFWNKLRTIHIWIESLGKFYFCAVWTIEILFCHLCLWAKGVWTLTNKINQKRADETGGKIHERYFFGICRCSVTVNKTKKSSTKFRSKSIPGIFHGNRVTNHHPLIWSKSWHFERLRAVVEDTITK